MLFQSRSTTISSGLPCSALPGLVRYRRQGIVYEFQAAPPGLSLKQKPLTRPLTDLVKKSSVAARLAYLGLKQPDFFQTGSPPALARAAAVSLRSVYLHHPLVAAVIVPPCQWNGVSVAEPMLALDFVRRLAKEHSFSAALEFILCRWGRRSDLVAVLLLKSFSPRPTTLARYAGCSPRWARAAIRANFKDFGGIVQKTSAPIIRINKNKIKLTGALVVCGKPVENPVEKSLEGKQGLLYKLE